MGIMDKIKSRDINFGSVEDKKDEVKGQETSLTKTNTSTIVQRDLDTSGILKVQTNLDLLNIDFDFRKLNPTKKAAIPAITIMAVFTSFDNFISFYL